MPDAQLYEGDYSSTVAYLRYHGVSSSHTFIGYGYTYFHFHTKDTVTISKFIKVADGWWNTCYFNYDLSKITDAVAIKVFK